MSETEEGFAGAACGAVGLAIGMICIAAIAVVASIKVDEDGNISFDEELFEETYKTLVGAYILGLKEDANKSRVARP